MGKTYQLGVELGQPWLALTIEDQERVDHLALPRAYAYAEKCVVGGEGRTEWMSLGVSPMALQRTDQQHMAVKSWGKLPSTYLAAATLY